VKDEEEERIRTVAAMAAARTLETRMVGCGFSSVDVLWTKTGRRRSVFCV
jgi:hypothetical protein